MEDLAPYVRVRFALTQLARSIFTLSPLTRRAAYSGVELKNEAYFCYVLLSRSEVVKRALYPIAWQEMV